MKNQIEIRKPDGTIEMVDVSAKVELLTAYQLAILRKKTRNAGRGEILRGFVDGKEITESPAQK